MAASVCTSGLAAPDGPSSSSSTAASHRPCALTLPGSSSSGAGAVSSSTLLDELAQVACSPQSPLMQAVQAVWPDFNLSPLGTKAVVSRRPPAVNGGHSSSSHRVTNGTSTASLKPSAKANGSHRSKARPADSRKMAEEAHPAKRSPQSGAAAAPACFSPEQLQAFAQVPSAALRCFQSASTLLALQTEDQVCTEWIPTEVLRQNQPPETATTPAAKDIAEMTRLRVVDCHLLDREESSGLQNRVRLTFRVLPTSHQVLANCPVSHPYLVEKKGWTSLDPESTMSIYGLSCQQLSIGDLCVPPVTMEENGISIGREEIMPSESSSDESSEEEDSEESQAARLLSQLAKGQHVYPTSDECEEPDSDSPKLDKRPKKKPRHADFYDGDGDDVDREEEGAGVGSGSGDNFDYPAEVKPKSIVASKKTNKPKTKKPPKKTSAAEDGADGKGKQEPGSKRPMNAFMLFAKKYRQEVTKQHPGKDNRAISTLLGTYWKELDHQERVLYVAKARALAQEHQKQFPNCWKRKRTHAQAASKS